MPIGPVCAAVFCGLLECQQIFYIGVLTLQSLEYSVTDCKRQRCLCA
jgi:hypothetical protein